MPRWFPLSPLLLVLAAPAASRAGDLVVGSIQDGTPGSLREVIAASEDGDRIFFAPTLAGETLVLVEGPIFIEHDLTVDGSGLAQAVVLSGGGGSPILYVNSFLSVTLKSLVLTAGSDTRFGGGAIISSGELVINDCTFHGNTGLLGGAIFQTGFSQSLTVENSTFTDNTALRDGGAIYCESDAVIRNCTILNNVASSRGGGIYGTRLLRLENSIVAANAALASPDVFGIVNAPEGVNFIGGDPVLAHLGDYGGPLPTAVPLAGSPIIDPAGGSTLTTLPIDQRGGPRPLGATVDSGAVEHNPAQGLVWPPDGTTSAPIGDQEVLWSIEADADQFEIFVGATSGALELVGTTAIGRFGMRFPEAETTYYWRIDAIRDGARTVGAEFSLTTRGPLLVTTLLDEDDGTLDPLAGTGTSLREAIEAGNSAFGGDLIRFAPGLAGGTITLAGSELRISGDLRIVADDLAGGIQVSANRLSRVLSIAPDATVELTSLAIMDGMVDGSGGGIESEGKLTLRSCRVTDNSATETAGIAAGTLELIDSTISRNISAGNGTGGISASVIMMRNSTVAENTGASTSAGGIKSTGAGPVALINCTVALNNGKGIRHSSGDLILRNCTVAGNRVSSGVGAGVTRHSGTFHLENTIIAGNYSSGDVSNDLFGIVSTSLGVNLIGGDPLLAPLGDYGGPTDTMPPVIGSPAIDPAGGDADSILAGDQRGFSRLVNGILDVGAVEFGPGFELAPAPGATGVAGHRASLIWTIEPNADSYEVFLGSEPGNLSSAGTTTIGLWKSETLVPDTTYYWRIDAVGPGGTIGGSEQQFTTRPAIQVTTVEDEDDGSVDPAAGAGTSLREAIANAEKSRGGDVVGFAPDLDGTVIVLDGREIVLTSSLRLDASALPNGLAISANRLSRVLRVEPDRIALVRGLTLRDGVSDEIGGGVLNEGSLAMVECTVTGNEGGGIVAWGPLTLESCNVLANRKNHGGAGLDCQAETILRGTTVAGNSNTTGAAGINISGHPLVLEQCTVTGNRSEFSSGGIGSNSGDVTLRQCTVVGNSHPSSSTISVSVSFAQLRIENSIVVVGDGSANSTISASDLVEAGVNLLSGDPGLAPLGNYGGPTFTMPPVSGSPTIDPAGAANDSPFAADQRGLARVLGSRVDTGATEFGPAPATAPADGAVDVPSFQLPLYWAIEPGADSHEVFLGTQPDRLDSIGSSDGGLLVVEQLPPGTTHFWRIDSSVGGATVSSDVFSFTTRPAFLVTTVLDENDPGPASGADLSLREALALAETIFGGDSIRFDPALEGKTISLDGDPLPIRSDLNIDGSGLQQGVTISGAGRSGVFEVEPGVEALIRACTIRDAGFETNSSGIPLASGTGIINRGRLTLSRSSIVENRAAARGGGIHNQKAATLIALNCTLARNRAPVRGGGIYNEGTMVLRNSTVSQNRSSSGGGVSAESADNHLVNTIVAGNLADPSPDFKGVIDVLEGVNLVGGDALLAPLGAYGGPTPTMPPARGSAAINPAGSPSESLLATDQRGTSRLVNGVLDVGSVEHNLQPMIFPADGSAGHSPREIGLYWNLESDADSYEVYFGKSPAALESRGTTASGLFLLDFLDPATSYFWRIDSTVGGQVVTGAVSRFDTRDAIQVTTVVDEDDGTADPDSGAGTALREAVAAARSAPGIDLLRFLPTLDGRSITLDGEPIRIDDDTWIDAGSLESGLTISGNGLSRVLTILPFNSVVLENFTIADGMAGSSSQDEGGGIFNDQSDLLLRDMTLRDNGATDCGGAIYCKEGSLRLENSTLSGNHSGDCGGGLYLGRSECRISNSTFAHNSADRWGGAIHREFGTVVIEHTTVTGNSADAGGGLYDFGGGGHLLLRSIVAGNSAPSDANLRGTPAPESLGSITAGDPRLAPLANYGGRTATMPPLPGSLAIDFGPPGANGPPRDQRGAPRPTDAAPDCGAVEAFPFILLTHLDTDLDGIDDRLEPAFGFVVGDDNGSVDSDRDGDSDAVELDNMTDPLDRGDFLRLLAFSETNDPGPGIGFEAVFTSFPGLTYRLTYSTDLVNFMPLEETDTIAADFVTTLRGRLPEPSAFVRVERTNRPLVEATIRDLSLAGVTPSGDLLLEVTFTSVPEVSYLLEFSSTLQGFEPFPASETVANASTTTIRVTLPAGTGFLRVKSL